MKKPDFKSLEMTNRDKKILIMLAGILILILSYWLIFNPQMEKANEKKIENVSLRQELDGLLALKEQEQFYQTETKTMDKKVQEYMLQYPADIKEEDGIMLARGMENSLSVKIASVGLGEKELIANMGGAVSEDASAANQETLMEQGDKGTRDAVNEVEGQIDGSGTGANSTAGQSDSAYTQQSYASPALYRTQNNFSIELNYMTLKQVVDYLKSQNGRVTIESINVGYDSTSGLLNGNMNVNMFSMTGTDATYMEPATNSREHGNTNLFRAKE